LTGQVENNTSLEDMSGLNQELTISGNMETLGRTARKGGAVFELCIVGYKVLTLERIPPKVYVTETYFFKRYTSERSETSFNHHTSSSVLPKRLFTLISSVLSYEPD